METPEEAKTMLITHSQGMGSKNRRVPALSSAALL